MSHVLGPADSRQRRLTLLGAALVAALLAVFVVPRALAVHDIDTFELDGDAVNGATAGDDWNQVCHEVTITNDTTNSIPNQCASATDTAAQGGATGVSWTADGAQNASIFTGGGSKDPNPIGDWKWKNEMGGLPDKDNLQHAFAARYSVPESEFGGAYSDPCQGETTCDVIYFGMDRFDNSGDAQNGFWFFQSPVSADPSTGKFSGTHTEGDLLIVSDFSNGGTTATINVYKWVDSGGDTTTHLDFLKGGDTVKCDDPALVGDAFCGVVNSSDGTTAPWSFGDKSGNSIYLNGEFYEGGINLSDKDIDLAGQCFASVLSESRSSTSASATLKDFILGPFGSCETSISSTQKWTPYDEATIDVTGASTWGGTVTFTLYPNSSCTGTAAYTSNAIPVSNSDATATTDDSTGNKPSAIATTGTTNYCWKVFFDADAASEGKGVPDKTSTVEVSTLTVDNDNTSP